MSRAAKVWISLFIVVLVLAVATQINFSGGGADEAVKEPTPPDEKPHLVTFEPPVYPTPTRILAAPINVEYEQTGADGVLCRQMFLDNTGQAKVSIDRQGRAMTFNLGSTRTFTEGLGQVTATDTFISGCQSESYRTYPVAEIPLEPALGCPVEVDNNNEWAEIGIGRNAMSVIVRIKLGDVHSILVSAEPGGYAEYSRFGNPSLYMNISVDCREIEPNG